MSGMWWRFVLFMLLWTSQTDPAQTRTAPYEREDIASGSSQTLGLIWRDALGLMSGFAPTSEGRQRCVQQHRDVTQC